MRKTYYYNVINIFIVEQYKKLKYFSLHFFFIAHTAYKIRETSQLFATIDLIKFQRLHEN
jgi:hypothetical protein